MTRDSVEIFDRSAAMQQYVPRYYQESRYYNAQNTAKGYEFDILRTIIDDCYYQFNPQTATWSLGLWEELLGIKAKSRGEEERRTNIMAKIMLLPKITPISLERLISRVTGTNVRIINNIAPYVFAIDISTEGAPTYINYDSVVNLVEDVKPAHLAYETYFSFPVKVAIMFETVVVEKWPLLAGEEDCGTIPQMSFTGVVSTEKIKIQNDAKGYQAEMDLTGTKPDVSSVLASGSASVRTSPEGTGISAIAPALEGNPAGEHPDTNYDALINPLHIDESVLSETSKLIHTAPGEADSGTFPDAAYTAQNSGIHIKGMAESKASQVIHKLSGEDSSSGSILKKGVGANVESEAIPLVYMMCGEEGGM